MSAPKSDNEDDIPNLSAESDDEDMAPTVRDFFFIHNDSFIKLIFQGKIAGQASIGREEFPQ